MPRWLVFLVMFPSLVFGALFLGVILVRWFAKPEDRPRCEQLFVVVLLTVVLGFGCEGIASLLGRLRPVRLDLYAFQLERVFGYPSFRLGQLTLPHPAMYALTTFVYCLLPVVVFAALTPYVWQKLPGLNTFIRALLYNVLLASVIYLVIPVSGPCFAFGSFPAIPHGVTPHVVTIAAAPNGIPSVHLSTALLVWWFTRTKLAALFVALTVFATLALGQHYLIDLLLAVPFAAMVVRLVPAIDRERGAYDEVPSARS